MRRHFLLVFLTPASGLPAFPLQFVTRVKTTAHLIDESLEYPPRYGEKLVFYDYINKRAKAAILSGLDAGKNYTRRIDLQQEYRVRGPPHATCDRSYASDEKMPKPDIPIKGQRLPDTSLDGHIVEQWIVQESPETRSIVSFLNGNPRRLRNEWINDDGQTYYPLMTYDFLNFQNIAPDEAAFHLDGWQHHNCSRWIGGWPSLHLFHWFFRF